MADYKQPDAAGLLPTDWFTHTLDVTVDASPKNRWVNWFSGGLNTHVVHHLFPSICHIHYLPLTPIVVATAREFGLTYHQEPFWRLVLDHFRHLARLGIKD